MHPLNVLGLAVGLGMDAMSVSMAVGVRWHGARQKFRLAWHMGLFQFLMPIAGWAAGRQLAVLLEAVGSWIAAALVFLVGAKMLYEALKSHKAGKGAAAGTAGTAGPAGADSAAGAGAAAAPADGTVRDGEAPLEALGGELADAAGTGAAAGASRHPAQQPARRNGDPTRGWSLVVLSVATSLDALVVGFSLGLKEVGAIWRTSAVIGLVAGLMALTGVVVGKRLGQALGRPAEIVGAAVLMLLAATFPLW